MKKRLIVLTLAVLMLLQCGCAVAPALPEAADASGILSSDDVDLVNATSSVGIYHHYKLYGLCPRRYVGKQELASDS